MTQPTEGDVQGVHRGLHPPGLHSSSPVSDGDDHLPVPPQPLLARGRLADLGAGVVAPRPGRDHRRRRLDHPGLSRPRAGARPGCPPRPRVSGAARRVEAWPTRRPTDPSPGRSRPSRASTGSATRTGRVIYVGKAKNLRSRLSSYFQDIGNLHPRTADDGHHRGQRRVDRRQHRGRGAPAGVLLDQGVRPALQREVPRRQVLPLARGHRRRGVPAGDGRPRRQEEGHPLLRPLQPRLGDPRDRRPAAAGLPDALLLQRRLQARPARSAGPACSATSTSARRPCVGNGHAPRSTARSSTTSATSWPATPTRSSSASSARCTPPPTALDFEKAARLRDDLGALEQGAGEAGGGARRRHRRRRDRARRGPARGRRADLLRPRRPDPRPARLGRRPGRGGRHRRAGRATSCSSCTPGEDGDAIPREILVPALPPDADDLRGAAGRARGAAGCAIRVPQRGDKRTLQETVARNAGQALVLHKTKRGQRPDRPQPGARGDPAGARARRGAAADRVLRHLQPPGHRGGRLMVVFEDGLAAQERVPPVRDPGRRRARTTSRRCTR